jgi:hypothetical protein
MRRPSLIAYAALKAVLVGLTENHARPPGGPFRRAAGLAGG